MLAWDPDEGSPIYFQIYPEFFEPGRQPMHLDSAAPFFSGVDNYESATHWSVLSCIVQLTDGLRAAVGPSCHDWLSTFAEAKTRKEMELLAQQIVFVMMQ